MATNFSTALPVPAVQPIANKEGVVDRTWYMFFVALFNRTGSGQGVDIAAIQAEADAALALAAAASAAAAAAQVAANNAQAGADGSLKIVNDLSDVANAPASRVNLGLVTQTGWTAPTGTPTRNTFNADASVVVSAAPTQAEVQAINDQLVKVAQHLAALIDDSTTFHVIGP